MCDFMKPPASFPRKAPMRFTNKNEPENALPLGDSKPSHFTPGLIFSAKYAHKNAVISLKPTPCIPAQHSSPHISPAHWPFPSNPLSYHRLLLLRLFLAGLCPLVGYISGYGVLLWWPFSQITNLSCSNTACSQVDVILQQEQKVRMK